MNTDAIQISSRDSNARSILKDIVRKHVPAHYGLSNSSGKAEVVQSNIKRVKSLLDHSVFHSLGTRAQIPTGYMVKTLRSQSTCDSNMPSDQMLSTF